MSKKRSLSMVAGLIAIAGACQMSLASTVTATFNGVAAGTAAIHVNFFNTRKGTSGETETAYCYAGVLQWKNATSAGSPPFGVNSTFNTFCIEFTQDIGGSDRPTYTVDNLSAAPKPYGASAGNPASGMGVETGLGTATRKDVLIKQLWAAFSGGISDTVNAAAFQISIWKIIYEDSSAANAYTSMFSGNFKITDSNTGTIAAIGNQVNNYLTYLRNNTATAPVQSGLYALTNASTDVTKYQDQLYFDGVGGRIPPTVPLSSASMMGGSLMVGLLARRSRRA